MKVIPLSEAKANLSKYGQMCRREPVVITVNGRPSFQLAPIEEDEDLVDQLLEKNPGFRSMLEARLSDATVSVDEALRRFGPAAKGRAKSR